MLLSQIVTVERTTNANFEINLLTTQMTWLLALFISIGTYSGAALLQKVLMKGENKNPLAYSAFTQLLSAVMVFVVAIVTGRLVFPESQIVIENKLYLFILLSAICFATNAYAGFKALQHIDVSKFIIIFAFRTVVTIILSAVFLKESLTTVQLAGTGLILVSIILVNSKSARDMFVLGKGGRYALLAAIAVGVGSVTDKHMFNWFDFVPYLTIGFLFPGTLLVLAKPKNILEFPEFLKKDKIGKITLFTLLYTLAALSFYWAFVLADNAALVSSIGQISTILTVLLGIIILKEREDLGKKLLGGVLSFIGLFLLTL